MATKHPENPEKSLTTVRFNRSMWEWFKQHAAENHRTANQQLDVVLLEYREGLKQKQAA